MPLDVVKALAGSQLRVVQHHAALFEERVRAGKILEGQGDLRPEHICLEREPVMIDCLKFNRAFRILDTVSESAFLVLECEGLGASWVGASILQVYEETMGDRLPERLLRFYQSLHACLRAKIAVWHLKDNAIRWQEFVCLRVRLASGVTTKCGATRQKS